MRHSVATIVAEIEPVIGSRDSRETRSVKQL